jgi:hypothetical protein
LIFIPKSQSISCLINQMTNKAAPTRSGVQGFLDQVGGCVCSVMAKCEA